MIDLCIDARMAYSAGIGTYIRQLAPFFNQPPFRAIFLVTQLGQKWCRDFEQIHFPASIYSLKEQALFPAKVPRCNVLWSPHYNVPLLPTRAKKRVTTIHDACHLALGKYLSPLERMYAKIMMKRALHQSDAVATDSHFSKNELHRYLGMPKKALSVIPAAVNEDQFQRVTEGAALERIRDKYRLPSRFFLYVGNLKPHKNLSGLLQAFEQVSLPDWGLVIVGRSQGLRNSIAPLVGNRIFALGEVPDEDLASLYSLAQLFVFPSFYEGFGLPPLEAMSCGCPTIVSKMASIPEICGGASLYFQPDKPEEIAEMMMKVVSDEGLRKKMIQQGFRRVQIYNWERTATEYRELFQRVCRE